MTSFGGRERPRGPNVAVGILLTAVMHAGLLAAALLLHHNAEADTAPRFVNIVDAKLVRLGTPIPEKQLPRLVAAPAPPPPDPGVKVSPDETPPPKEPPKPKKKEEPPKKKRRRRPQVDPEQELMKKLSQVQPRSRQYGRGSSRGTTSHGGEGPVAGDPRGDPEGEVISARDQIQGNLWAAEVRRALHRAWAIPEVISDSALRRLKALVVIRIDKQGKIRSWRFRQRASGVNASLFNGSVSQVFRKVRTLPSPPAGAFKIFKGGWLALRFTKAEADKVR